MRPLPSRAHEPLLTPAFLRLWAFSFTTFFSAFQLFPGIPFRILELGGTKAAAGFFLAFYTWACALSAPLTGAAADHFGRRRVMTAGSALFVLFSLLYGFVTTWPLLLAVAAVHGLFWSAILASSAAVITEAMPASRRTEGIAYWGLASTLAVAVAPLVGLKVFEAGGWRVVCLEMALLSAGMAFIASGVPGGERRAHGPLPPLPELVDWRVMVTGLSLTCVSFGYGGITSYVALMSIERGIRPPSLFFTVFALSMVGARLLTARVGDRFGPRALLLPSFAVIPPAMALLSAARTPGALTLAAVLFGAGFGGVYPGFAAFVLQRTEPVRRAATFGSILWAFDTGIGAGSLVTGILVQRHGFGLALLVGAAVGAAAIPAFLGLSGLLGPGTKPAPASGS